MIYNINVAVEKTECRGIAQLVEQWSPKPRAVSSSLTAPVKRCPFKVIFFFEQNELFLYKKDVSEKTSF